MSREPLPPSGDGRLDRQLAFLLELDRLKAVLRETALADGSRPENTAEHSWHVAVLALVLAEHAEADVDVGRVVAMLLLHDVVEVDAGDTFAYDPEAHRDKEEREVAAAERLFGLLPQDQGRELRALWDEFEAGDTVEARFARALDRLHPILLNLASGGVAWRRHGIAAGEVVSYNAGMDRGSARLWGYARRVIEAAVERGHLEP